MPDLCWAALFPVWLGVSFPLLHLQLWVVSQFAHCMSGSVVQFSPATRETRVRFSTHAYDFGSKWGEHHSRLVRLIWRGPGSKSYVGQKVNQRVSVPPNSAIRWHDWSISERRFVHRQFQWSATDKVVTQTWFFSGVLINSGQGEIACQCRTKTGLLLSWQLVWSTSWYSMF